MEKEEEDHPRITNTSLKEKENADPGMSLFIDRCLTEFLEELMHRSIEDLSADFRRDFYRINPQS